MEILTIQVRENPTGELEAFFYEHYVGTSEITSFCFSEGHNTTCDEYRLKLCKPVKDTEKVLQFAERLQKHYNSFPFTTIQVEVVDKLNINQNRY